MNGIAVRFQVITLSVTLGIILFFIISELNKFCSKDMPPAIHTLTPHDTWYTSSQARVRVGLTITDFPQFEVTANKFKLTGILWFIYDPSLIAPEVIEKFSFRRGEIEYKSQPSSILLDDKVFVRYDIKVAFQSNLYYGFFPFEDHRIYLSLINTFVHPGELIFESSHEYFFVENDVQVSGWRYYDHRVMTGFGIKHLAGIDRKITYPEVLFEIDFFQDSLRYILTIILPLLIIFLIDMFSLCLDQHDNQSTLVQLSSGNIIALVAYRFVMETIAPHVGYLMIADYIFYLFLFTCFATFVINSIGPYLTILQKKIVSLVMQSLVLSVFTYLFTVMIQC